MVKLARSALLALPLCAAALALSLNPAKAVIAWPSVGNDTLGPVLIITIAANGAISTAAGPGSGQGAYDGVEDNYIGVVNNSTTSVSAIGLTSAHANGSFGFDGDGVGVQPLGGYPGVGSGSIQYGVANAHDSSGYGGPIGFFTSIVIGALLDTANVNFFGGLAAGSFTWFSLEGPASSILAGNATPLPATWSMMLMGFAGIGFMVYRGKKKGSAALAAA